MSDNDDKTKIRTPTGKITGSEDATRIAPVKRTDSTVVNENDKTRIATPAKHQQDTADKTRIPDSNNGNTTPPSDVTRFNPNTAPASGNSRASSLDPLNEITDALETRPAQADAGEHGILKERFILEKVLGVGGMGIVYKAKDLVKVEAHDREPYVAIKVLSEEFKTHPEAFLSLQRESRKSQRFRSPNIVVVNDFDRDGDTVFMTMELLEGTPLDQLIRQYKSTGLPTDDAWNIIQDMSSALSHAHAERIIHSDFKPGNVFVTKNGTAKVFDFGIARAVAKVEHLDDNPDDKTIFDAGNLGALTPAYASLEMLEGKEPDIRDDIYALGCVAYELFTGEHPYNRIPADEAERQGLKPKRITNIKKRQWRAIEKAIAFRREDRIESVDKFIEEISPKIKATNRLVAVVSVLLTVLITSYFLFFQEKEIDPYSEFDIRNELELKIKIDFYKEDLASLIENPVFTTRWQDLVWKDVSDLAILTKGEDPWLDEQKNTIYGLYLHQISSEIEGAKYTNAEKLIDNAKRYTDDTTELDVHARAIATAVKLAKSRKVAQTTRQQEDALAQQQRRQVENKQQSQQKVVMKNFDVALDNVNSQLKCQNRLNMRDFETAINKLRELDRTRYGSLEGSIINSLATCIKQMGKAFPERALEAKKHSLRIFGSNSILANISIEARDSCDISLAGLGARGKRAVCKDKIKGAGTGPELVVIPKKGSIKAFAIGKYEVSIDEMNKFCKTSSSCDVIISNDSQLPVSNIRFTQAKAYLKWLSRQSGQKYRLPTKNEWVYAATSRARSLDANRNCKVNTRGIQKGDQLVKASIGKQNSWGLVNYVGNVQEWVYDQGRKLIASGGSFNQSMEDCDISTTNQHDGSADRATGFRVLRELRLGT